MCIFFYRIQGKDQKQLKRKLLVLICACAPQATRAHALQSLRLWAGGCMRVD